MKHNNKEIKVLLDFLGMTIGAFLSAFALEEFLIPNSILDGGVAGISIIIHKLSNINLGLLVFFINIPFIYVGYRNLGRQFLLKALYSIGLFSILLEMFATSPALTGDPLLGLVYGGALLGIGVGLVIRSGGCIDGTESVAIVISKNTSLSVGQVVLLFNMIIFGTAGFFFGIDRALYSLLTYVITFKVIDFVSEGLTQAKEVMIITDYSDKISDLIYERLGRTCTIMKGSGLISGKKDILYVVLTRLEIPELRRIINDEDYSAFVTVSDISEIIGKHIKSNKEKDRIRKKIKKGKNLHK